MNNLYHLPTCGAFNCAAGCGVKKAAEDAIAEVTICLVCGNPQSQSGCTATSCGVRHVYLPPLLRCPTCGRVAEEGTDLEARPRRPRLPLCRCGRNLDRRPPRERALVDGARVSAHLHKCPECYLSHPCGLSCEIIDDGCDDRGVRRSGLDGLPRGCPCVCASCLRRAGLPLDTFCTALPEPA